MTIVPSQRHSFVSFSLNRNKEIFHYLAIERKVANLYERHEPKLVRDRDYGSRQSDVQFLLSKRVGGKSAAGHRVGGIVARFVEFLLEARGEMVNQ